MTSPRLPLLCAKLRAGIVFFLTCAVLFLLGCDQSQPSRRASLAERLNPVSIAVTNGQAVLIESTSGWVVVIPHKLGRYDRLSLKVYEAPRELSAGPAKLVLNESLVEGGRELTVDGVVFSCGFGTSDFTFVSMLRLEQTNKMALLTSTNFQAFEANELKFLTNSPPSFEEFEKTLGK